MRRPVQATGYAPFVLTPDLVDGQPSGIPYAMHPLRSLSLAPASTHFFTHDYMGTLYVREKGPFSLCVAPVFRSRTTRFAAQSLPTGATRRGAC